MEMGMQSPVIIQTTHHRFTSVVLSFILRIGLVFFLTVDATAGLAYVLITFEFRWGELIPSVLAVFSGLSAGFFSRLILRKWARFFRWLISVMVVTGTMAVAGLAGLQWLKVDLTLVQSTLVQPDFFVLVSMGCFTAWLVVFAWRRRVGKNSAIETSSTFPGSTYSSVQASSPVNDRSVITRRPVSRRKRSFSILPDDFRRRYFRKGTWRRWRRAVRIQWTSFCRMVEKGFIRPLQSIFRPGTSPSRTVHQRAARLQIQVPEQRITPPTSFPTPLPRRHSTRKAHKTVRLIGKEEMRCPYCLQIIEPHDPNGIVVCPICHTAHHKECWDITGSCQVPHNHAML